MTKFPALAPLHMSITAADGVVLKGNLVYPHGRVGTRYPLAVLAHQYPSTRDSYAPLCTDLHTAGIATLAFDLRGHGESVWTATGLRVIQAPIEPTMASFGEGFMASAASVGFAQIAEDIVRVTAWGLAQNYVDASRLLLVGASVGGTGVLLAAPRLKEALRGVVTFGAAGAGVHSADAAARIRRHCETLRVPLLLTSSEGDPFDGARSVRDWSAGLAHAAARIVPGSEHAMAIYYQVRADVLRFVRAGINGRPTRAAGPRAVAARKRRGGRRGG
jgi:dienelactone hydrolase